MSNSPWIGRRSPFLSISLLSVLLFAGLAEAQTQSSSTLTCSPCSIDYGNVSVGGSEEVPVTLANTGTTAVTLRGKEKSAPWFFYIRGLSIPYTIPAGQSVTFNAIFAPTTDRASSGTFTFVTGGSNGTVVLSVKGTGIAAGTLTANPPSLGFGRVPVGTPKAQAVTITNSSSSPVTLNQISTGSSSGSSVFSPSGATTPLTLAAGQSFTFQVTFSPTATGDSYDNLVLLTASGAQFSIAENGFGLPAGVLTVSPTSVNFGNVTVGSSQSKTVTLTASSNPVVVSSDSLGSAEYSLKGLSLPLSLAAGQSVPVTVVFSPQSSGTANTNLAFSTGSGSSSSVLTSLTGTGVAPVTHTVALSWQPSVSQVTGYNVYRGSQSGGPYTRMNSSSDSSTNFDDSTVQSGNSYFYQVTSVDSSGVESVPSSPVEAVIP